MGMAKSPPETIVKREELSQPMKISGARSIWRRCVEPHDVVEALQYKDYVLTLLSMSCVSILLAGKRGDVIDVLAGASFADMPKPQDDKEIGDKMIGKLPEVNDLKSVVDQADFNGEGRSGRGKEIRGRRAKVVAILDGLGFRADIPGNT